MKITERRLRSIIKSVIRESAGSHSHVISVLQAAADNPLAQDRMGIVNHIMDSLNCASSPDAEAKSNVLHNVLDGFGCFQQPQGEYFTGPGYSERIDTMRNDSAMLVLPQGDKMNSLCIAIDAICKD